MLLFKDRDNIYGICDIWEVFDILYNNDEVFMNENGIWNYLK